MPSRENTCVGWASFRHELWGCGLWVHVNRSLRCQIKWNMLCARRLHSDGWPAWKQTCISLGVERWGRMMVQSLLIQDLYWLYRTTSNGETRPLWEASGWQWSPNPEESLFPFPKRNGQKKKIIIYQLFENENGNLSMSDHLTPAPLTSRLRGTVCSVVLTCTDFYIHGAMTSDFLLCLAKRCPARGVEGRR